MKSSSAMDEQKKQKELRAAPGCGYNGLLLGLQVRILHEAGWPISSKNLAPRNGRASNRMFAVRFAIDVPEGHDDIECRCNCNCHRMSSPCEQSTESNPAFWQAMIAALEQNESCCLSGIVWKIRKAVCHWWPQSHALIALPAFTECSSEHLTSVAFSSPTPQHSDQIRLMMVDGLKA